ncbi:hypothetical protein RJ639_009974 [Escallonia herrerae]|uniref:Uncharacterized protein n=1 Tax=Escallonia herrerae TaxID=1293975 RepID=A0AA88VX68_9ASTE|nr:hypothetical protein RJ639_009974 [Escallonia herrerae]
MEEYTKTIIRVQETYETLSDPQTKASYDIDMSKGLHLAFSPRKSGQNDQSKSRTAAVSSRSRSSSQRPVGIVGVGVCAASSTAAGQAASLSSFSRGRRQGEAVKGQIWRLVAGRME